MHIKAENLTKSLGGTTILEQLTMDVKSGEHVALVGRNGCGKTTLLSLLARIEFPDEGRVIQSKDSKIGYLHQIPSYPDLLVKEVLLEAFDELLTIEKRMKELELCMAAEVSERVLSQYGELQESFMELGGYEMESRLASIANGLGITQFLPQKFKELSGGEKTKVMLGQILLENPDILLLDEPTNHLDLSAIQWLEQHIQQFQGIVILVSHDRQFMNRVVHKVIELEDGQCWVSHGNYDAFLSNREAKLEQQFSEYKEQQKKIKKIKDAIRRLRQWANEASPPNPDLYRKAKSMEKMLTRIEVVKRPKTEKAMRLSLEAGERSGKEVVRLEQLSHRFSSSDPTLFDRVSMSVFWQDRIAIVGDNGTGKSTLLKLIMNQEIPTNGRIHIGSNVNIGYLAQQFDTLNNEMRLIDAFRDEIAMPEPEARHVLAQFLFYGHEVFKKIKDLSGGEKMRLRLAQLMQQNVNLLLLDEPTNHLDIESREVLEDVLENFEGTIIAVSHDRYFLQKLFLKIAWIDKKTLTVHDGDFEFAERKQTEL
ncbi:ribosomal protection-like ABC-F family protein [Sporosarcina aquimarina]|uniref:ABC-F type ribosomal protection protein n=1 Tax=Sporosarcina aquimarina TaxID=114975 RepID=A0ABU4FZA3_9BACL|nr:ABC-F type ribosomal protection protein [Sporosarcina aquimarina]MDW0109442.1 ABC-F type ribosomal protection protein [Sporosarcina aquimarina]